MELKIGEINKLEVLKETDITYINKRRKYRILAF